MVERASGGTLFLDEVTEMSADMQTRLLRFLETRCFFRVGGTQEIKTDVRVVAATNRSPVQAVRDGSLREDLLYRLAVFPITLAPLRERGEDVVLLAEHFLDELNVRHGTAKVFSSGAKQTLREYHWPGNVRELKNADRARIHPERARIGTAADESACRCAQWRELSRRCRGGSACRSDRRWRRRSAG